MKKTLKKLLPKRVGKIYRTIKKHARFVPEDERISFDTQTIYNGHFNVTYRGVRAIKCPFDYVMYQMIISELKPDLVIEIGTSSGGGALYMADLMNILGHGMVHTINIERKTGKLVEEHPRIKLFTDGFENYDLNETKGFSKILVIDDASHLYEDTLAAMHKMSPLVSVGSYFIVEDGIVDELGKNLNGGPLRAIREFLSENKNFEVDRTYCDMFGKNATFNVNGYLKRIK
ncbi:MAG: hypothetical protein HYT94_04145 [Parcubacteria group bacterium]|nr:hypothetical protein [Parcubacteria group bacterium]